MRREIRRPTTMLTGGTSVRSRPSLRLSLAARDAETFLMDECPSCGARLTGQPSWCPRCLSRLDRVDQAAAAREFAAAWSAVRGSPAETAPPAGAAGPRPTMYTPYTPPPPPVPNPTIAAAATIAPAGKNRIPRTVVLAILMGVVLQVVSYALVKALHLQAPTAVALGLGLTITFYLLVLSLVQGRLSDSAVKPVWHIGPPAAGLAIGVTVGAALAFLVIAANSALAGHLA